MPRRSTIDTLSPALRRTLDRRLRASAYGDLADHAAWLTAAGHPIKKTQVWAYARKLCALDSRMDRWLAKTTPQEAIRVAEIRATCLQAAIATGPAATALDRAEEFVDWAFRPGPRASLGLRATAPGREA